MPTTCPTCGECEVFVAENPVTGRDEIRCLACDWSSPDVPPFMIAMLQVQLEDTIAQIEGQSKQGGPKAVSQNQLVDEMVAHLRKTIAVAQELKGKVAVDGELWDGLCEIQDHAQEAWSRVIPFRC
jgi:hypothetical protein